jgi:hypothetical protein
MAGNYMDAPAQRLAWDRDGVGFAIIPGSPPVVLTQAQRQALNNESNDDLLGGSSYRYVGVILPYAVDLRGVVVGNNATQDSVDVVNVQVSKDTTNGEDGTWTAISAAVASTYNWAVTGASPGYRLSSRLVPFAFDTTVNDVVGVRVYADANGVIDDIGVLHLYADPVVGTAGDALLVWQDVADLPVTGAWFDFGDVARGSSSDRLFRVKNVSASKTAHDVTIFREALTDASPSVVDDFVLSSDGGTTWLSSLTLGDMAPGAVSSVLKVRRTTPTNAALSVWSARMVVEAASWS